MSKVPIVRRSQQFFKHVTVHRLVDVQHVAPAWHFRPTDVPQADVDAVTDGREGFRQNAGIPVKGILEGPYDLEAFRFVLPSDLRISA